MPKLKKMPAVFYQTDGGREPGFVKKTKKTPKPDLDLAKRRAKEITR